MAGVPNSKPDVTGQVLWALSDVDFTQSLSLNVTTDKEKYYPNEMVKITAVCDNPDAILTGYITEEDGSSKELTFTKEGDVWISLNFADIPGTYIVSVEAKTRSGLFGVDTTSFIVLPIDFSQYT